MRALVPGPALEVPAPAPRDARAACGGLPGVLSAHLLGDRVRLLVADGTPPDALASGLLAKGVGASVNVIEPDMEAAFAYLAEVGEAVGESSDSPAEVPR